MKTQPAKLTKKIVLTITLYDKISYNKVKKTEKSLKRHQK